MPRPADAEGRISSLAYALAPDDRAAFITAATETIEALGPSYGEGVGHRVLAPIWKKHFKPPASTAPLIPARGKSEKMKRRMKSLEHAGQLYRSRLAIGAALGPSVGLTPSAFAAALRVRGDDIEATLARYGAARTDS